MKNIRRWIAKNSPFAILAAAMFLISINSASAFCGFYVARADSKLFNEASRVVLVRHDDRTTITMASDYDGSPAEFALVIPVPTVVQKKDVNTVAPDLVKRIDEFTAPRLTEYFDRDPCEEILADAMPIMAPMIPSKTNAPHRVTVEAKYEVGVYDILILSAKDSDGLVDWLRENQYRIPDGAEETLGSYLRQGMHFFVAKVNMARQAKSVKKFLEPLQVAYSSPKFMLPIRLGTLNARGPQDLIIYTITANGRVETANYPVAKMATSIDLPLFVHDDFASVYKAAFDRAVEKDGMQNVYLEYAWDLATYCDPCAATPPTEQELATLGVFWAVDQQIPGRFSQDGGPSAFITRLHVRYDRSHFPEDLALSETRDRQPFQVVYKLHHPVPGFERWGKQVPADPKSAPDPSVVYIMTRDGACLDSHAQYFKMASSRPDEEVKNLSSLTGWSPAQIEDRMEQKSKTSPNPPP